MCLNRTVTVTKVVNMPREGQESVTISTYVWDKAKKYFAEHKAELRKKGIRSPSKLVSVWIEEKCAQG